jgi:hypothetical protein
MLNLPDGGWGWSTGDPGRGYLKPLNDFVCATWQNVA